MKDWNISNRSDLCRHLQRAEATQLYHQNEFRNAFGDFKDAINPVNLVKETYHDLAVDQEVRTEMKNIGLNILANLLIGGLIGKRSSIAGFIGSTILENIPASAINNVVPRVTSFFGSLFSRKKRI